MLLKKLSIIKTFPKEDIIRDIKFNPKGLSLIIDKDVKDINSSGNNIGKTTAIKIIDLCLGANNVKSIYYDDDTGSENEDVRNFLEEKKVKAELIFSVGEEEHIVSRELFKNGKVLFDSEKLNLTQLKEKLKEYSFNSSEKKPSFRQLIPKFVRVGDYNDNKIIKFLYNGSKEQYDNVYMFLLKILPNELLNLKDSISLKISDSDKKIKMLEKDKNIKSLSVLEQRDKIINDELYKYENKRKELDYMEEYKEELKTRHEITLKSSELNDQLQLLYYDVSLIEKSIERLDEEKANIDIQIIKELYEEANAYIEKIDKSFEEVMAFHNSMIENRIKFIKKNLEKKLSLIETIEIQLEELLEKKKQFTLELLDEGLLDELNIINEKIKELNIEQGEISQSIKLLKGAEKEKQDFEKNRDDIVKNLNSDNIYEKVGKFNEFFSKYSEDIYGEKYIFTYNKNWKEKRGVFPVSIDNFQGNVGTGKKKGIIVAFDLAYISYCNYFKIKAPKFVIHDKLENTHINQLRKIFNTSSKIKGQYIVPILFERISKIDKEFIEKNKVLELDSNDKFFRI